MSYHTFDIEVDGEHSSENLKRKQTKIKYLATTAILLLATLVCTVWIQTGTTSVPREGVAVTGVITYMSLDINRKAALFEDYKKRFQKKYNNDLEEAERFSIFLNFLVKIDKRNSAERGAGGTAIHGITKFADRNKAELRRMFGYQYQSDIATVERIFMEVPEYTGLSLSADWSEKFATKVRDQGFCGSCWAFSAVQQIESDAIRAGYLTTNDFLSVQQVSACDPHSHGCGGGTTERAYYYIMRTGGVSSEQDYPYSDALHLEDNNTSACMQSLIAPKIALTGVYGVRGLESALMDYVLGLGPLSICIDASTWDTYVSGVVSACGKVIDHCVQIVGVDKETMAWKVRNQWGTDWGEDGYIYLRAGQNTCGLTHDPTFVTVKHAN